MSTLLEKKLQGTDWQIGDAADFLQLSVEESALIEIRLSLAQAATQSRVQHEPLDLLPLLQGAY